MPIIELVAAECDGFVPLLSRRRILDTDFRDIFSFYLSVLAPNCIRAFKLCLLASEFSLTDARIDLLEYRTEIRAYKI